MATVDNQGVMTMQELIASSLAQTDELTKLLIEKGIITKEEFMVKLSDERAVYREMLGKMGWEKWQRHANGSATRHFPNYSHREVIDNPLFTIRATMPKL